MATLTPQSLGGVVTPTYNAVSASDTFLADPGGTVLVIRNGGGSTDNVTITDAGVTPSGNLGTAVTFSVPAAGERWYVAPGGLANTTTGAITVAHSFTTSVTMAVMRGA